LVSALLVMILPVLLAHWQWLQGSPELVAQQPPVLENPGGAVTDVAVEVRHGSVKVEVGG
jgi:hypothetical protein